MNIKNKIVICMGVFVAMLMALVVGVVVMQKPETSNVPVDNGNVTKPTTYTYQAGQVELVGTNQNEINFKYEPITNATETAIVKAYEYIFGRPENAEETMAVTLKPIGAIDGVDISYAYSDKALTFDEAVESSAKFKGQTIDTKGADIYIYILISPSDPESAVNFTTDIVWNFGNAGTVKYEVNGETITETIVKGQDLPKPENPTAPTGYYFDAWFMDAEFKTLASFPLPTQGQQLYARFHNVEPGSTSVMKYSDGGYTLDDCFTRDDSGNQQYNLSANDVIVPTMYDDGVNGLAPVIAIGEMAFDDHEITSGIEYAPPLSSIQLPYTITIIGNSAFSNCQNLTAIDLTKCVNLTTIGDNAFFECYGITNITIPTSVTTIGGGAFGSTSITNIVIPNSVTTTYWAGTFNNCDKLVSVTLPAGITTIGNFVFNGCTNLVDINLEECVNLTRISSGAFDGCVSLTEIKFPNSLQSIEDQAFYGCSGLTEFDLSNTQVTMATNWFYGSGTLKTIKLPTTLQTISDSAFSDCTALSNIDLTKCTNLTSIRGSAFKGCDSLTSINIPASVNKIGAEAFMDSGITLATFGDNATWYAVASVSEWNSCTTSNATEITGLTTTSSTANADALVNTYSSKYWFRVD